jgi:hypothetical protein
MLKFWELGQFYVVPKHLLYWMVFFPIMVRVWGSMFWAFAFHYHTTNIKYIYIIDIIWEILLGALKAHIFFKSFILNKAFLKIHFKIWICKKLWNEIEFIILHEQSLLLQHEGVMRWLKPLISLQLWMWGGFNFLLQHLILAMGPHCVGGIWSLPFEKWERSYTYE